MTIIDLGKIKFQWQGPYDASLEYTKDDVVFFDGSSYVAIGDISANQSPADTENWQMMTQGMTADSANFASQSQLDELASELPHKMPINPPFLVMGSYGGWGNSSLYPVGSNVWTNILCFQNISINQGGFIIDSPSCVRFPKQGIYNVKCTAYTAYNDYQQTRVLINGSNEFNQANNHAYQNGYGSGLFPLNWDMNVHVNEGDSLELSFNIYNPTNNANIIYHAYLFGSITFLGE